MATDKLYADEDDDSKSSELPVTEDEMGSTPTAYNCKTHNIFILSIDDRRKRVSPEAARKCLRSFAFAGREDRIYLYGPSKDYDVAHLSYLCGIFSYPLQNVVFTPGTKSLLFDDVVDGIDKSDPNQLENWILAQSKHYDVIRIRSYSSLTSALQWFRDDLLCKHTHLKNKVFLEMESVEWRQKFGNKSMLHRSFKNREHELSICEQYKIDQIAGMRIPKGFHVESVHELLHCYRYFVDAYNIQRVVLKPVDGTCGTGIVFIDSVQDIEHYSYPLGKVFNVEENLCATLSAECGWILNEYWSDKSVSVPLHQRIRDRREFIGSVSRESEQQKTRNANIMKVTSEIAEIIEPNMLGGFDFYVPDDDKQGIYLVDVNTARMCGSHPALHLAEKWNRHHFETRYVFPTAVNATKLSFADLQQLLADWQLAFDAETKCGVLVLAYSRKYLPSMPWIWMLFGVDGKQFEQAQARFDRLVKSLETVQNK